MVQTSDEREKYRKRVYHSLLCGVLRHRYLTTLEAEQVYFADNDPLMLDAALDKAGYRTLIDFVHAHRSEIAWRTGPSGVTLLPGPKPAPLMLDIVRLIRTTQRHPRPNPRHVDGGVLSDKVQRRLRREGHPFAVGTVGIKCLRYAEGGSRVPRSTDCNVHSSSVLRCGAAFRAPRPQQALPQQPSGRPVAPLDQLDIISSVRKAPVQRVTAPPNGQCRTPAAKSSTPAAESSTPAAESSTPAAESSTPAAESSTPAAESSTPAAESSTPAAESSTPAAESSTPAAESSTPAAESSTPAAESSTSASRFSMPASQTLPKKTPNAKFVQLLDAAMHRCPLACEQATSNEDVVVISNFSDIRVAAVDSSCSALDSMKPRSVWKERLVLYAASPIQVCL